MERAGHFFAQAHHFRRSTARVLAALVWPPVCIACGADVSDPHGLCGDCWRELRLAGAATCIRCARPMPEDYGGKGRCEACADLPLSWRQARTAAYYNGTARKLVLALKHGDRPDIARPMAAWMVRAGRDVLSRGDLVIPVPLHWTRRIKRRLNQSAELSRRIAKEAQLAHGPGLLIRTRPTDSQRGRSFDERRYNVAGAFACPAPAKLAKRRVVLVDDVMTTGATLNAATRALREAGAASVDTLVFARVAREADDGQGVLEGDMP